MGTQVGFGIKHVSIYTRVTGVSLIACKGILDSAARRVYTGRRRVEAAYGNLGDGAHGDDGDQRAAEGSELGAGGV